MNATMFEIKNVFCERKRLADVLEALAGLLVEPPVPVPVLSAKAKNGKVESTLPPGSKGSSREQLIQYVIDNGYDSIDTKMVQAFLKSIGRQPLGSGSLINSLMHEGFLTKPKGSKGVRTGDWLVDVNAINRGEK
jgi:hypothetical protein